MNKTALILIATLAVAGVCLAANGEPGTGRAESGEPSEILNHTMRKLARMRNDEALKLFQAKDYPGALAGFKAAYDLDPENPEVANNLGYLYNLLGNRDEAERYYREALILDPDRYQTYVNFADLIIRQEASQERLAEAAGCLTRAREIKGNRPTVIVRQARVAARRGLFEEAERFYREYIALAEPRGHILIELGDFFRDFGRDEEAIKHYRRVTDDEELSARAAKRIWEIEVDRQARRFGWSPRVEAISPQAKERATKGRILYNQGRYDRAETHLREAIALSPSFAMARADLGDLLRKTDRTAEAELAYLQAVAIDNGNAEIHARLGRLYLDSDDSRRAAEAALFLKRALELEPDWSYLRLPLAEAYQRTGNLAEALRHVNQYLGTPLGDEERQRAATLQTALQERLPTGPNATLEPAGTADSSELGESLARVRAHLLRGEIDAAMAVLQGLPADKRTGEVLDLEARILRSAGRPDEAETVLRRSLAENDNQAGAHALLGVILLENDNANVAREHLLRARELGERSATLPLAKMTAGGDDGGPFTAVRDSMRIGDLLRARNDLSTFLAGANVATEIEQAESLRKKIDARIRSVFLFATAVVLFAVAAWIATRRRRYGGIDLETFLDRHPDASPEVQSVLSAIRHEVLKHNTMVLSGLIDAMERDSDAGDKARFFRKGLLGPDDEEGVMDRLAGYAEELEKTARARKVRLNLEHKDPALGALLSGFALLRRVLPDLERVDSLEPGRRGRVLATLKKAATLLNETGYSAVQDLLDRLRSVNVNRRLLGAIFDRIRREPAFSKTEFAPVRIDIDAAPPCAVMAARKAFEDVLGNLIRNAIDSSCDTGTEDAVPVQIGLRVASEVDRITGLERLLVFVRDRSEQKLTTEMLRGRYIEEGLGLTADLVSRYDGSLEVRADQAPWTKAVVVKFPRAFPHVDAGRKR